MSTYNPLTDLIGQLQVYQQRYPQEASTVQRFLEFAHSGEPLQGKTNPRRHITASAWILGLSGQQVLLTLHRKLAKWLQLGGHTDIGEAWAAAALREATEESGLSRFELIDNDLFDIDIHVIPAYGDTAAHLHYDLRYLLRADSDQPLIISHESKDLAWVNISQIDRYTNDESQLRLARKSLAGLRS